MLHSSSSIIRYHQYVIESVLLAPMHSLALFCSLCFGMLWGHHWRIALSCGIPVACVAFYFDFVDHWHSSEIWWTSLMVCGSVGRPLCFVLLSLRSEVRSSSRDCFKFLWSFVSDPVYFLAAFRSLGWFMPNPLGPYASIIVYLVYLCRSKALATTVWTLYQLTSFLYAFQAFWKKGINRSCCNSARLESLQVVNLWVVVHDLVGDWDLAEVSDLKFDQIW